MEKKKSSNMSIDDLIKIGNTATETDSVDEKRAIYTKVFKSISKLVDNNDTRYLDFLDWMKYMMIQVPNNTKYKGRIAILGYKNRNNKCWDHTSIDEGIGGSEEAVIYASDVLVEMGYHVTIFMQPKPQSYYLLPYSNPLYLDADDYQTTNIDGPDHKDSKYDLVLCWRNHNFNLAKQKAKKVWFWAHDIISPGPIFSECDGIIFLTNFHRDHAISKAPRISFLKYVISGNGVNEPSFHTNKRDTYKCIYASNYSRGLANLIDIWPEIQKVCPKATLDVYFGKNTYGTMPEAQVEALSKRMTELGIKEHGMVGHKVLYKAFCQSSLWLYPYVGTSETFCITAVKAQRAGCIPVVVKQHGLKETVAREAFSIKDYNKDEYIKILTSALEYAQLDNCDRKVFSDYSENWTWKTVVESWISHIDL